MVAETQKRLPALSQELRRNLDVTAEETYRDFFRSAGKRAPDVPIRSGYYIGFRIAERVGQGKTLAELARLGGRDLRARVDSVLAEWGALK